MTESGAKQAFHVEVDLKVNGEAIGLVPFVENILGETIVAMVKTLHGGENPATIEIQIKNLFEHHVTQSS